MTDHIQSFIQYIEKQKRLSQHTVIAYCHDLIELSDYFVTKYEVSDIQTVTHHHIRSFVVEQVKEGKSAKSVNRYVSCFRSFFKYLQKNDIISANPMLKVRAPRMSKRLPQFLQQQEVRVIFQALEDPQCYSGYRDRLIFLLLYNTGIRRSELINIQDRDVDMRSKTLSVIGKGNKQRQIPLPHHLIVAIQEYIEIRNQEFDQSDDYLLLTDKGKKTYPKLIYNTVHKIIREVIANAKGHPHLLRHTFATHLSNNGAELNAVKELLGHSSLAATQIYTHNSIDRLKEIHQKTHPRANTQ